MRWGRAAGLFALVVACGGPSHGATEDADLEWLRGTWRVGEGPGGAFELWGRDEGGGYIGLAVQVDATGAVRDPELMWIEPGAAAFVALPGGRRTRFRRSDASDRSVRFLAPEHDSPKWVRYRRDGAALEAAIGDTDEASARWRFERWPSAPSVERAPVEVCRSGERMTVTRAGCFCGAHLSCGVVSDARALRVAILDQSCDGCSPVSGECAYDPAIGLEEGECAPRDAVTLMQVDLR